jgi:hypothetical protein
MIAENLPGVASAFENRRIGRRRPQWAPSGRDLGWPTPDRLLWAIDMSKRTFSPA